MLLELQNFVDFSIENKNTLEKENLPANVSGRQKTPYSIRLKTQRKNVSFEQISDIIAFRIIVDCTQDCYAALGVINQA